MGLEGRHWVEGGHRARSLARGQVEQWAWKAGTGWKVGTEQEVWPGARWNTGPGRLGRSMEGEHESCMTGMENKHGTLKVVTDHKWARDM